MRFPLRRAEQTKTVQTSTEQYHAVSHCYTERALSELCVFVLLSVLYASCGGPKGRHPCQALNQAP